MKTIHYKKHDPPWSEMNEFYDEDDCPESKAIYDLLALTERLCEINPKQGLRVQILLFVIEWCAEKLIFKKKSEHTEER